MFIITFDEHGGFYDHVPPPMNVPNPDGLYATDPVLFKFDRLGVRVPTLMISPWINKVTIKIIDLTQNIISRPINAYYIFFINI